MIDFEKSDTGFWVIDKKLLNSGSKFGLIYKGKIYKGKYLDVVDEDEVDEQGELLEDGDWVVDWDDVLVM